MLFNSVIFAIFLPIVFFLYWFVFNKNLRYQNRLLLTASYFFYAWWDWRFLFLLLFSTGLDFFTGLRMSASRTRQTRRFWLWLSILINLGFLGVFKYYDFFVTSFTEALARTGWNIHPGLLNIILPVGISFYTFHGLSYVIDVYNKRIPSERNFVDYAVFVSFFPLLVAGPIERATHLLPQIRKKRTFEYARAVDGLKQILWGLFKKIAIADQCASYTEMIFGHSESFGGSTLVLGVVLFTFQIYGDFSGYSDIAIGTARLFGIDLLRNFAYPFFSRDIAEFWRRWHISLTTWFRDYLYIPLGGGRGGTWMRVRNTFIVFLVSGLWHGDNWTYIAWGALNALYVLPLLLAGKHKIHLDIVAQGRAWPTLREAGAMLLTFALTVFAFIFFRAESMSHAWSYLSGILSRSLLSVPSFPGTGKMPFLLLLIALFLLVEWYGREQQHALARLGTAWKRPFRYAVYYGLLIVIFCLGSDKTHQFIYFQF